MSEQAEKLVTNPFEQRNREIGLILVAARQREQRTVTECAAMVQTTRRRYSMIERGEASISAAELEAIMRFLNVPAVVMWHELEKNTLLPPVVVKVPPGSVVQFVVEVQQ
jgi:transcriptional regulator with XRE-family HTH domain